MMLSFLSIVVVVPSDVSGVTWSSAVTISSGELYFNVDLEIGQNNIYVLTWIHSNGPVILFKSDDGGNTWTRKSDIFGGVGILNAYPGMCVYSVGNNDHIILGSYPNDILKSTDSGDTFSPLMSLPTPFMYIDIGTNASWMGKTPDSDIYVVGSNYTGSHIVYFSKSIDNGSTWSTPISISETFDESYRPRIISDGNALHVVYTNIEPGENFGDVCVRTSSDWGMTWSSEVLVFEKKNDYRAYAPAIQYLDENKAILMIGDVPDAIGQDIGRFGYLHYSSMNFEEIGNFSGPEWNLYGWSGKLVENNKFIICWTDALDFEYRLLKFSYSLDSGLEFPINEQDLIPVSNATSVTVYEKTGEIYSYTFDVETLMGTGGIFTTVASITEQYTVTSDGTYVTIHCWRDPPTWLPLYGPGGNIVAVRLNGVPNYPDGIWANLIVDYYLGENGVDESRFNALGPADQIGPWNDAYATWLGDYHSEITLGFSALMTNQPPIAIINAPSVANQGEELMIDGLASTDPDGGSIVSFEWDLGNNITATGPTVTNIYNNGLYVITLTVLDDDGQTETSTQTITIQNLPPIASISGPETGWEGDTLTFDGSGSYDPDPTGYGGISTYDWAIDGEFIGTGEDILYTFPTDGIFNVSLMVTDIDDSTSYSVKMVTIVDTPAPVAVISAPSEAKQGEEVTLNGSASYDPDGTIVNWTWDFGDGNIEEGITVTHTWEEIGTYLIQLTVRDNNGSIAIANSIILIRYIYEQIIPISAGTGVTIYEKTGEIRAYTFDVSTIMSGGGVFSTAASIQEEYVITSDGVNLTIHCWRDPPIWLPLYGPGGNIVAARLDGVPDYLNGIWANLIVDYYLGENGVNESIFNALGPADQIGPWNDAYATWLGDYHSEITLRFLVPMINLAPIAVIETPNIGYIHQEITTNGSTSYDPDGVIVNWTWDLGDGNTEEGISVTHAWEEIGQYSVQLTVTDNNNSTDIDITNITIYVSDLIDTDNDGLPDGWEYNNSYDMLDPNDALIDEDNDGLNLLQEYLNGSDPQVSDTDGDQLSDGFEVLFSNTDPTNADTDNDGIGDGLEFVLDNGYTGNVQHLPLNWIGMTIEWANYTIYVKTNSSVLTCSFDKNKSTIVIEIGGIDNTIGATEFSIPKELCSSSDIIIKLNDQIIAYTLIQNETHYTAYVEYEHSSHELIAQFSESIDEGDDVLATSSLWLIIGIISVIVIIAAVTLIFMRKKRSPIEPQ